MANRLTDTAKWDDPFFMALSPDLKLLWLYLCDRCDHAGIWKVNAPLLTAHIGKMINLSEALEIFKGRIEVIENEKWYIKGFIAFQYRSKNPNSLNKAHLGVLRTLEKYGLEEEWPSTEPDSEGPSKGLRNRNRSMVTSFNMEAFEEFWNLYPRKVGREAALKAWGKVSPSPELLDIIKQSIKAWSKTEAWKKDNGQYIPHPSTWLNGKRWNDEVESGRRGDDNIVKLWG